MTRTSIFTVLGIFFFMVCSLPFLEGKNTVLYTTVPKSGTFLVRQILQQVLTQEMQDSIEWIEDQHLVADLEKDRLCPDTKKIIVIRDLRDVIVSASYWLVGHAWVHDATDLTEFRQRDHQGQLDYLINWVCKVDPKIKTKNCLLNRMPRCHIIYPLAS